MTDYTKLVEELKHCSNGIVQCDGCSYAGKTWDWGCEAAIMANAADAIEELQQIADHHEQNAKDYWKKACEYKAQVPKRGEIVRCGECKWYGIEKVRKDGTTPDKRYRPSVCLRGKYAKRRDPDWFCADGEREVQE